jgi:hypothetical protein
MKKKTMMMMRMTMISVIQTAKIATMIDRCLVAVIAAALVAVAAVAAAVAAAMMMMMMMRMVMMIFLKRTVFRTVDTTASRCTAAAASRTEHKNR